MRREVQQLAALVEAAAAGEAWAAEDAPPFPEDRVVTQRILGPSRNLLPQAALILLGGVGLALGGSVAMALVPGVAALTFGRRFTAWSWCWCDSRAQRELQAVLPRFARARLRRFHGGIERLAGMGRFAPSGIALAPSPLGTRALILVERGVAARIPWHLIRGWAWQAGDQSACGGLAPPAISRPGLTLALASPEQPIWHVAATDPTLLRGWGDHLSA